MTFTEDDIVELGPCDYNIRTHDHVGSLHAYKVYTLHCNQSHFHHHKVLRHQPFYFVEGWR